MPPRATALSSPILPIEQTAARLTLSWCWGIVNWTARYIDPNWTPSTLTPQPPCFDHVVIYWWTLHQFPPNKVSDALCFSDFPFPFPSRQLRSGSFCHLQIFRGHLHCFQLFCIAVLNIFVCLLCMALLGIWLFSFACTQMKTIKYCCNSMFCIGSAISAGSVCIWIACNATRSSHLVALLVSKFAAHSGVALQL